MWKLNILIPKRHILATKTRLISIDGDDSSAGATCRRVEKNKKRNEGMKEERHPKQWQTGYSPRPTTLSDQNQTLHGGWPAVCSYTCQVWSKSVKGLRRCGGSKMAISHYFGQWLIQQLVSELNNDCVAQLQCYTVVRATQQVNGKWQIWGVRTTYPLNRWTKNLTHVITSVSYSPRKLTTHSWSKHHQIVLDANGTQQIIFCIVNHQVYFHHLFLCLFLPVNLQHSSKTKSHNSAWHCPPTLLGLLTILHLWYHLQTSASFPLQLKMKYSNWFLIVPTNTAVSMRRCPPNITSQALLLCCWWVSPSAEKKVYNHSPSQETLSGQRKSF